MPGQLGRVDGGFFSARSVALDEFRDVGKTKALVKA
jgi:hypothetical protein